MSGIFYKAFKLVAETEHWTKSEAISFLRTIEKEVGGKIGMGEDHSYAYWIYPNTEKETGSDIIMIKCIKALIEDPTPEDNSDFPVEWNVSFLCNYGDNGKLLFERTYLINPPTIDTLKDWKEIFTSLRGLSNYESISLNTFRQMIEQNKEDEKPAVENQPKKIVELKKIPQIPEKAE